VATVTRFEVSGQLSEVDVEFLRISAQWELYVLANHRSMVSWCKTQSIDGDSQLSFLETTISISVVSGTQRISVVKVLC
jgi:hypothetical protein